jgi:beta-glucosidase
MKRLNVCMPALCILWAGMAALQGGAQSIDEEAIHRRASELVAKMTVEEKVGQLNQISGRSEAGSTAGNLDRAIEQGQVGSILWLLDVKEINRLQHLAVDKTRLHIPLLVGNDVLHGRRTMFPVPLAMASSWDTSVEEQAQRVSAQDARASGLNWTFAPMLDIARDARWGRIVEGAGEDPYLGAAMARAQVLGFQGPKWDRESVLACAKHFAGYGAADGGRDYDSSYIPETLLRNVYLIPFHAAEQAGIGSFMSAYMDLNDVPAAGNRWLLHDVLRSEWDFKGFVISDAEAVAGLLTHGYARDPKDAAYTALTAGLSMDMDSRTLMAQVPTLVAEGRITRAQLDQAVLPVIEAKIRLGLFEQPYVDEEKSDSVLDRTSTRDLARKLAGRSMILLRNENHTLPLSESLMNVAVIGPLGETSPDMAEVEDIISSPSETHAVSVVAGLKNAFPKAHIEVVDGPKLQRVFSPEFGAIPEKAYAEPTQAETDVWIARAVASAKRSDVVVAAMGESATMTSEGSSRATLDLPGIQEEMLQAVIASGKPVVLVLINGRPLDIRWASEHVPAILETWYSGSEGGNAIADVLRGRVNPGGKLPVSWPRVAGQEPLYYNHNLTHWPESSPDFTSRYWDISSKPLYPFGYGLSYSTFKFSNLRLSTSRMNSDGTTEASVEVTNISNVQGDEVVEIYIHQRAGSTSRPVRELKGFKRVTLAPNETQTLKFPLGPDELRFWSSQTKSWAVEPGMFDVWAGGDSTATLHAEFEVTGIQVR